MRKLSHFIAKVCNKIQFFLGGRLILKSQALTSLKQHAFSKEATFGKVKNVCAFSIYFVFFCLFI